MRVCDHLYELRLFERNLADSKHRHSMINLSSTIFDMIVCAQDNLININKRIFTFRYIEDMDLMFGQHKYHQAFSLLLVCSMNVETILCLTK